jgi:hypothetical protein
MSTAGRTCEVLLTFGGCVGGGNGLESSIRPARDHRGNSVPARTNRSSMNHAQCLWAWLLLWRASGGLISRRLGCTFQASENTLCDSRLLC